jgi:hypothetical protein
MACGCGCGASSGCYRPSSESVPLHPNVPVSSCGGCGGQESRSFLTDCGQYRTTYFVGGGSTKQATGYVPGTYNLEYNGPHRRQHGCGMGDGFSAGPVMGASSGGNCCSESFSDSEGQDCINYAVPNPLN